MLRWRPSSQNPPGGDKSLDGSRDLPIALVRFGLEDELHQGMSAYLELRAPEGHRLVALLAGPVTIGKSRSNHVPIPFDRKVSRLHAVFEPFPAGWCIRDLGARNGTYVNGSRVTGARVLLPGDEIRVGNTCLRYRVDTQMGDETQTEGTEAPPALTRREREVLVALCRPVLHGDLFTEPASIRDIAAALVVTEAAVKQHLGRLYYKFGLRDERSRRRVQLANHAIRRGAVSLSDLQ